ncbi:MAG: amidohydrolase family protein [Balneolaceae bacterium]|nr:amidohydrolase family protein [Balneolaceae bacterium]
MKKILALLLIPIAVALAFIVMLNDRQNYVDESKVSYAFTNVHVIPMTEDGLIKENQTVIITEGRISEIVDANKIKFGPNTPVIDGTGKYLIPGLAEMHGHVPPTHPPANFPAYFNEDYVESTLFLYVSAGITTVRGMLGYDHQLELKEKVASGEYIGPNLYLAGPSFNGNSVSSLDQAREKVRQQVDEGWDLLKIHPGLTLEEYNAMADEANKLGIRFGGHVPQAVGINRAIEAGQETMDHIDGYVSYLQAFEGVELESKMDEIIQKTKEYGVWIVPTQALWETIIGAADYETMQNYDELKYIPQAVRDNYNGFVANNIEGNPNLNYEEAEEHAVLRQRLLGAMSDAGVRILMGTDAPQLFSVPGFSIHRELPFMKAAGMSNYEILHSGTKAVGDYFANEDDFGTIEVGKRADLILMDSNPLESLDAIRNHSGVMVSGEWLSRKMIDEKLAEIEAMYN